MSHQLSRRTLSIAGAQVVFWAFTFPMNAASQNWTVTPPAFEQARQHWEYSHAAGAVLMLIALICLAIAAVRK